MNNKQIKNKKRTGLYLGLGISLAAIAAGATVTLVATLSKGNNQDVPENKVLFNAGEGHVFDAKQKTKLVDCTKQTALADISASLKVYNEQDTQSSVKDFVGWAYEKDFSGGKVTYDKIISADTKILPKSSIKAVYKPTVVADEGITWKTVSFERGSSADKANITGNTKFNIISGTTLREINCPVCEPKVAGEMKFVGWKKLGDTQQFSKDVPITQDTSFEPIMSAAAKITFIVPEGATIVGLDTVTVQENTKFGDINTPVVECTSTDKIFAGWYQDQEYKNMFPSTMQISGDNVKAYAKIVDKSDTNITVVSAQAVTGVTYEGNTEFAIARNAAWNTYNRPIPKAENQKIKYWEYQVGTGNWTMAADNTTFGDVQTAKIRPVLESTISDVVISSEFTSLPKNQATAVTATVLPSTVSQSVTWKLFSDVECKTEITDETKAKVEYTAGTNIGNVTVFDAYDKDTIYVQAASTIDTTKVGSKGFTFANPYVSSADFWVLNETDTSFDKGWYRLENLEAEDMTKKISLFKNGQSTATKSYDRTAFNQKIYVGDKVTSIPANFLRGCSAFNSEIKFTSEDANYSVRIGDNFMRGCAAFAQTLDVTNVTSVGDNFLLGANAFVSPLTFTKVYSIGDNFLLDHTTYNAEISLGTTITRIGTGFLENCSSFNQNLALPASITSIGSHFLFETKGYGATLTVDCAGSAFDPNFENLSTRDNTAYIATPGFNIVGSKASEVPYESLDGTTGGFYRTIIGKVIDDETRWINKYTQFLTQNYPDKKNAYKYATVGTNSKYKGIDVSRAIVLETQSANEDVRCLQFYEAATSSIKLAGVPVDTYKTLFASAKEQGLTLNLTTTDTYIDLEIKQDSTTLVHYKIDQNTFITEAMNTVETPSLIKCDLKNITWAADLPKEYTRVTFTFDTDRCEISNDAKKVILVDRGTKFNAVTYKPTFTPKSGYKITGYSADGGASVFDPETYEFTGAAASIKVVCEPESEVPELPSWLSLTADGELSATGTPTSTTLVIESKYKMEDGTEREVKSIAASGFMKKDITDITIPASVTKIGTSGLATLNPLATLTFKDTTKKWSIGGSEVFDPSGKTATECATKYNESQTKEWTIYEEVEDLPAYFQLKSDGSLGRTDGYTGEWPQPLEIKSKYMVNGNPTAVLSIADSCFKTITAVKQVILPATLNKIGTTAFGDQLTELTFTDTTKVWKLGDTGETFTPGSQTPAECATAYKSKSDLVWTVEETETDLPKYLDYTAGAAGEISIKVKSGKESLVPADLTIKSQYVINGASYNVTSIADKGFLDVTTLTNVTLPDTLVTIGTFAFNSSTALNKIVIPKNVTSIGPEAFISDMAEIVFADKTQTWQIMDGDVPTEISSASSGEDVASTWQLKHSFNWKVKQASEVPSYMTATVLDDGTLSVKVNGDLPSSSLVIADQYYVEGKNRDVTELPNQAFAYKSLTSVTLPNTLKTIGMDAFASCDIPNVVIPASVTSMYKNSFSYYDVDKIEFKDVGSVWKCGSVTFTVTGNITTDTENWKDLSASYQMVKQ